MPTCLRRCQPTPTYDLEFDSSGETGGAGAALVAAGVAYHLRSVVSRSCSWFEPPAGTTSEPHGSLPAPTQTEGPDGELGSRTAGGMPGLEPCH